MMNKKAIIAAVVLPLLTNASNDAKAKTLSDFHCLVTSGEGAATVKNESCGHTVTVAWKEEGKWKVTYFHPGESLPAGGLVKSVDVYVCPGNLKWVGPDSNRQAVGCQ
jgi:hypothetical protein